MKRNTREQDIREIPCHDWEARHMTAKVCGSWTYFFSGQDTKPINKPPISVEAEVVSNPYAPQARKPKRRPLREQEEQPLDWYSLQRQRQAEMRKHQSMSVCSNYTFVIPKTEEAEANNGNESPQPQKRRSLSRKATSTF